MQVERNAFDDLDSSDAELDSVTLQPDQKPAESFLDYSARLAATNGKQLYKCERCRGTGEQKRKPLDRSPEATYRRERAATRRQQKRINRGDERAEWQRANSAVVTWVTSRNGRNNFATSLANSLAQYGTLTENQVAAVRKIIDQDAAYEAAYLAKRNKAAAAALASITPDIVKPAGLDLSSVPDGRYAVPNGATRLKVLIQKPEAPSKWAGFTFVSDAAEYGQRTKYGMQKPGDSYRGKITEELRQIAADPKAAAIAYGRLTGHCCICNRKLEDAESVAAGIGPICAGKF